MKSRIKTKIFSGFLLLVAMLAIAGVISIYELKSMSGMVDKVIRNNYLSVTKAYVIMDALENQDSGVLISLLQDDSEGGGHIINSADSLIRATIEEVKLIPNVNSSDTLGINLFQVEYNRYYESIQILISDNASHRKREKLYFSDVRDQFLHVKTLIKSFMQVNQDNIFLYSTKIQDKSRRAIMPGIIAIVSAIILTLMLNFFINRYFVAPIKKLTEAVRDVYPSEVKFNVTINTKDEILMLKNEIEEMLERFKK